MKLTTVVRILVLISLIGGSALIYAQEQRDEANAPRRQEEEKSSKQDEAKPRKDEGKPANHGDAKVSKQAEHAEHAQHAGSPHGRIPDDKFHAHFGRQHTLVVNRITVVEGQPRFQYSGYWFTIVDPWPVGWAYTDECYIDDVNGEYFLFDLLHPGVGIAIVVVL
jgi:hypothetical protein